MTDPPKAVTVYANPMSLVAAGEPTAEFLTAADEHLPAWLTIPISPIGDAFYEQASRIPGLAQANRLLAAHLHASHGEANSPPHPPTRRLDSEQACQLIVLNRQLDDLLAAIEGHPPDRKHEFLDIADNRSHRVEVAPGVG